MKKSILALLLAFVLCLIPITEVQAATTDQERIYDYTEKYSSSDLQTIETALQNVSNKYDMDVIGVIIDSYHDMGYNTLMEFADDYYDYFGYSYDGLVLAYNVNKPELWISTKGYGITAFTDYGIDKILDVIAPYFKSDDILSGYVSFANECDRYIKAAKSGKPIDVGAYDGFKIQWLVFGIVAGLIAALVYTGKLKGELKSVAIKKEASNYVKEGSFNLTGSRDIFLYRNVTRVRRESSSSGGGSSTHTSSSGSTHGGGGRSL